MDQRLLLQAGEARTRSNPEFDIMAVRLENTCGLGLTFDEARDRFSREYLAESLRITEGNVRESARLAKRNRTDFYKLLARYRLKPEDFKVEVAIGAGHALDNAIARL